MVTESDQLREALDQAALIWPELADKRTELLRRVLSEGANVVAEKARTLSSVREQAVQSLIKHGSGLWPDNFIESRKDEWPN